MSTDPFILTKEQIKELEEVKPKRSARRLLFFQFPPGVLERVLLCCGPPQTALRCLAVLMAVYEVCYKDLKHGTRIQVTSKSLKRYRVTRQQKYRALQQLHSAGLLILETKNGKNPWVTVSWLEGAFR